MQFQFIPNLQICNKKSLHIPSSVPMLCIELLGSKNHLPLSVAIYIDTHPNICHSIFKVLFGCGVITFHSTAIEPVILLSTPKVELALVFGFLLGHLPLANHTGDDQPFLV